MAFLLNTICPSCKKNSPVLIQSPTGKMHCGKCWRVWVGYEEPISRWEDTVKAKHTRKPKKELAKSSEPEVIKYGSIHIPLNAKLQKAPVHTGRMSTRKAQIIKLLKSREQHKEAPTFTVRTGSIGNMRAQKHVTLLGEQDRQERAELLWRYKALKVITQQQKTRIGSLISGHTTDTTLNTCPFCLAPYKVERQMMNS